MYPVANKILLIIGSALFLTWGCLDEIDLPADPSIQDAIVVEGVLYIGNPSRVSISMNRLFDFTANSLKPVSVRDIFLHNDDGETIDLDQNEPGVYTAEIFPSDAFKVEIGKRYFIEFETFDGRHIISKPEPLISTPEIGNLGLATYEKEVLDEDGNTKTIPYVSFSIEANIIATSNNKPPNFLWTLSHAYKFTDSPDRDSSQGKVCYIQGSIDVSNVNALGGNDFALGTKVTTPIYESQITYFFSEGYYLTAVQQSLSTGAYQYWDQIRQVINRDGNMFEAPAGEIASNYLNAEDGSRAEKVFGYFYATQTDTSRMYIDPVMVGSPSKYCPWPPNQPVSPGSMCPRFPCCDCLKEKNSSLGKPDFWDR